MTLGNRIREKRKELKQRLHDVANRAEISIPYLSDIERDRTNPGLKTLHSIAHALGISSIDLLGNTDTFGTVTDGALPPGLCEFASDPAWRDEVDEEWIRTLSRIEYRGKRPTTKQDWRAIYVILSRVITPEEPTK